MEWIETTRKPPQPVWEMKHGDVRLSVDPATEGDRRWQYFSISFGRFTCRPDEASLHNWPREAIEAAREALDAFEAEQCPEGEPCSASDADG